MTEAWSPKLKLERGIEQDLPTRKLLYHPCINGIAMDNPPLSGDLPVLTNWTCQPFPTWDDPPSAQTSLCRWPCRCWFPSQLHLVVVMTCYMVVNRRTTSWLTLETSRNFRTKRWVFGACGQKQDTTRRNPKSFTNMITYGPLAATFARNAHRNQHQRAACTLVGPPSSSVGATPVTMATLQLWMFMVRTCIYI